MKKLYTALAMGLLAVANAQAFKVTVTPLGELTDAERQKVTMHRANVIVKEDFSGFDTGEQDLDKWGDKLASKYDEMGQNIDPSLTHGLQWTGHNVFSADGAAGLWDLNPQDPAYINTPKMDYAGTMKVSFLIKALPTEWDEEDENGEMQHWTFTNTTVDFSIMCDDYDKTFDIDGLDPYKYGNFMSQPFYPEMGWQLVEVEFDNRSAYNDAYLSITTAGHALVDDFYVEQSFDKFMPAPVIKGFTGATENTVTVAWEKVSLAYAYYTYLYECTGYDEEGNPILEDARTLESYFSEEDLEYITEMGMTLMEYVEYISEMYGMTVDEFLDMIKNPEPDNNIGTVYQYEADNGTLSYTFTLPDPTKEYYYDIRSKYYRTFCDANPRPVKVIGTPENLAATDVTTTGFTANWSPITKAEGYTVDLYGVDLVEDYSEDFIIFQEDFDAITDLTDATDIANPETTGEGSDITIDDLTSTPGWFFGNEEYLLLVQGKLGLGVDWGSYRLTTPTLYVAGSDYVTINTKIESTLENYTVTLKFADEFYELPVEGTTFEGEFTIPTKGMKETKLNISGPDEAPIFIDYISLSQDLPAGAQAYTWLGREEVDKDILSYTFTDLDSDWFSHYAFAAGAWCGEGKDKLESLPGQRMIVDLTSGESFGQTNVGADEIEATEAVEVARYTIDGLQISAPVPGINIVRYSDGSVRKVFVK